LIRGSLHDRDEDLGAVTGLLTVEETRSSRFEFGRDSADIDTDGLSMR
jgi:hypothetical protein